MFSARVCTDPSVAYCYNSQMVQEAVATIEGLPIGETFVLDISESSNVKSAHAALLKAGWMRGARCLKLRGQDHLIKVTRLSSEEFEQYRANMAKRGRKTKAVEAPVVG